MPPSSSVVNSPTGLHISNGGNPKFRQCDINKCATRRISANASTKNSREGKKRNEEENLIVSGKTDFMSIDRNELRRRRNNDAARRSRQARRARETQNQARMAALERENGALRAQINVLKAELGHVRLVILATKALLKY